VVVQAPAKVNVILRVGPKESDGYHQVFSIVQQLSFADRLRVSSARGLRLTCRGLAVPAGADNLVLRAARRLRRAAGVSTGADIELWKRIPIGAGLGGGSSDAAAVALALNRLWRLRWPRARLAELLAPLGSDVALFLSSPLAVVEGRGEAVRPLADCALPWTIVVVYPDAFSSTAEAYRALDRHRLRRSGRARFPLTPRERAIIIHRFSQTAGRLSRNPLLANDFEPVISRRLPAVREARRLLGRSGATRVLLSGSGSAVFGLFASARSARAAAAAVRRAKPRWGAWVARPLRAVPSVRSGPVR